jgi:hypothetical protein
MATHRADGPFRLDSVPDVLWDMARMILELRADDQTIRRWVRERRLPGPTLRRGGRAYWSPADVHFFRRQRLRRIGAEMGEAVGVVAPTASGDSVPGIRNERANNDE